MIYYIYTNKGEWFWMNMKFIVRKVEGVTYEIAIGFIENKDSDYDQQYIVSVLNYGECFFESDLRFIAEAIKGSSRVLSVTDAINIQNAVAEEIDWVTEVKFDAYSNLIISA